MEILPGIGWANATPDADAEVYYNVNGTSYEFKGAGYHDKNWGTTTFMDNLGSWYWGHGRLGPYSLVWYDGTTRTGEEHVSAYVAKDGEILYASNSSLVMRPLGNFTHPPTKGDLPPGFHIQIDMGAEGIMEVDLNSTYRDVAHKAGYYSRWVGTLTGGIRGEEAYTGNGVYEQYAVLD